MFFDHKKEGKPRSYISLILALSMILSAILPADFGVLGASSVFGDETESGPALVVEEPVEGEETEQETAPPDIVEDIETEITSAYLDDNDDDGKICGTLTAYSKNEYRITVEYDEKAGIPDGAELTAQEVRPEDYLADTAEALGWTDDDYILYTKFFDITITKDGREIEPLSPVTVKAELMDANEGAEAMQVVHIDDSGATELEISAASEAEVSFETESFSVYGFGTAIHSVMNDSSDFADISIYSYGNVPEFEAENTFVEPPEEGFEPSKAFRFASEQKYWVKADLSENAGLDERESFALYTFVGDKAAKVISEDISADSGLCAVDEDAEGVVLMRDTGLRHLNLEVKPAEDKKVTLDGLMPKKAEAKATDVTDEYGNAIAAYDISILDGKEEYQPENGRPVLVEIQDPNITEDANLQLWHIKDSGEREEITAFTAEAGKISFNARGFSVYEIVPGPEEYVIDFTENEMVLSLPKRNGGTVFSNTINTGKDKWVIYEATNYPVGAWYFEKGSDGYYLYTKKNNEKYYLHNTSGNYVNLDKTNKTLLEVQSFQRQNDDDDYTFTFFIKKSGEDKWLQWSNGGGGIRFFTNKNDASNSTIQAVFTNPVAIAIPDDHYNLGGKTYGIMYPTTSNGVTTGKGLTATPNNADTPTQLKSEDLILRINGYDHSSELYVSLLENTLLFTFHNVEKDIYQLSTTVNGETKYLKLDIGSLTLVDQADASDIQVIPGTGDNSGKLQFKAKGVYINYNNNAFRANASGTWLSLVQPSSYQDNDFVKYSAYKVSVSDTENVKTGKQVIVYTRIWDNDSNSYKFYAVNYDGTLVECYERGNSIMWIGSKINTLLWDFTEYFNADGTPNYYYELYNPYSGKYIAPQMAAGSAAEGQVLSDNTIGINMPGRKNGNYYTQIMAWDDPHYSYASLKADDTSKIVPCQRFDTDTATFYFAIMEKPSPQELTTVDTINNVEYGIKMRMVDFELTDNKYAKSVDPNSLQNQVIGGTKTYTGNATGEYGLLKTNLTNDYPTSKGTGRSLSELYNTTDSKLVNHLFLESTHKASGYFEYDSCQNFATLLDSEHNLTPAQGDEYDEPYYNFTLYKQLGTNDTKDGPTMKHGQFLPYNYISPDTVSQKNPENLYAIDQKLLPESDPRKYEPLYNVNNPDSPDYHFGMELEAGFVQTPSGLDAWGHPIIFEFTGDDDFWLYVDGELVVDLGGIHSAAPAYVNFTTGEVSVNNSTGHADLILKVYETIYGLHNDPTNTAKMTAFKEFLLAPNGTSDSRPATLTLKEIFAANYLSRYLADNPEKNVTDPEVYTWLQAELAKSFEVSHEEADTYGLKSIFKDYSTHKMKIFYMERGAGASNLHMRFNLSDVKPGQVVLEKQLAGSEDADFSLVQYPFQIWYKPQKTELQPPETDGYVLLGNGSSENQIYVMNPTTNTPVEFRNTYSPPTIDGVDSGLVYNNVYLLNPNQKIAISFPDETIDYYIVECGISNQVYDTVSANGEELSPNGTTVWFRNDYITSKKTAAERPHVTFTNKVKDDALRTLSFKKELYNETVDEAKVMYKSPLTDVEAAEADEAAKKAELAGNVLTYQEDNTTFNFRLYLDGINSTSETLPPANMHKYRVKDPYGNYCQWVYGTGFVSIEENNYSNLTANQKTLVTFETSPNGSISKIPAGYTVEVPDLIVGTKFKVEERADEIPKGYKLIGYKRVAGTYITSDGGDNAGWIRPSESPMMTISNKRGYGITVNKVWTDESYASDFDAVYFAIYKDDVLLPDTVRRMKYPVKSLYYYFDNLDTDFSRYSVREVELTDPVTDSSGYVTSYSTIRPIADNTTSNINVTPIGGTPELHRYQINYAQGKPTGAKNTTLNETIENLRTDTVTNQRDGGVRINLGKYIANDYIAKNITQPLSGGKFTLQLQKAGEENPEYIDTFTSNSGGLVMTLYDLLTSTQQGRENIYIITETEAPKGYIGDQNPVGFYIYNTGTGTAENPVYDLVLLRKTGSGWEEVVEDLDPNDSSVKVDTWVNHEMITGSEENLVANINFYNKNYTFNAKKTDSNTGATLAGVVFALYRQVTGGNGSPVKDYAVYKNIVTDENGILPGIDQTLPYGVYYLSEISSLTNYIGLAGDIIFKISELGTISLEGDTQPAGVTLTVPDENNWDEEHSKYAIDIVIPNTPDISNHNLTVSKTVNGNMGNKAKDFNFTISIAGEAENAEYSYTKNGVAGITVNRKFTLRNSDTIVFSLPRNAVVTITEDNEDYSTKFQLDNSDAENVVSKKITMDGSHSLVVTNTRSGILPTGVAGFGIMTFIVGLIAAFGAILIIRKQKRA